MGIVYNVALRAQVARNYNFFSNIQLRQFFLRIRKTAICFILSVQGNKQVNSKK